MGIAREIYGASGAIEPLFRWIPHGRPVFTAGQSDPFGAVEEPKTFVGLPNGGYAIIGAATESISVYDATGTFLRSALADLDAAYASIGASVPKLDLSTGNMRIVWAGTSRQGLIYMYLSGLPVRGPGRIAVVRPSDGRLVKSIALNLPGSDSRRDRYNPEGSMMVVIGAVDDQIAVMDAELGILALY